MARGSQNTSDEARAIRQDPVLVMAERPVTVAIPAGLNLSSGEVEPTDGAPAQYIHLDRGFNVLAAKTSVWQLLDRDPNRRVLATGLPKDVVHVHYTVESLLDMYREDGTLDVRRVEAGLHALLKWAKGSRQNAALFATPRGRRLPIVRFGTLAELAEGAWGEMETAARNTGAAHCKVNRSFDHLGAVHDLAMAAGQHQLVLACRAARNRYTRAA